MRARRHRTVSMDYGHHLHVVEGGDEERPSVLFIHGAAGCSGNWTYQLSQFAERLHVVAPDLRGHGRSPWPGRCRLQDFDRDLDGLLDELALGRKFVVVAHSFGGCLATRMAERHPERVAGLALLNTAGHIPRGIAYRVLLLLSSQTDRIRRLVPRKLGAGTRVCQWLLSSVLKEWDCWSVYPGLAMPSLVALGGLDPLVPLALGRRMACALPSSRLHVVPSAGHVLMMERPAMVNGWLERLFARATEFSEGEWSDGR